MSVLLLALVPAAWAQTTADGAVRGTVTDAGTGETLPGVNVTLERAGAVVAGTATDTDGRYRLTDVAPGPYTLAVRFIGYEVVQREVVVRDEPLTADVRLTPAVIGLDEVEVRADVYQEAEDPSVALTRVRPQEVRQLAGGAEDVMRTLQTTPGVQAASDFSNQLIVRGGTPDQNLILLDDIEVYSPYQLSGVGSLLNPALIRQVDLYAGAFPAGFGDRLSSVLAVQTRDGRRDTWLGGQARVDLLSANLILEGRTGVWDGSWLVSGRQTYFDSFANSFAQQVDVYNDVAFPDFTDVQAKLVLRPRPQHQVRLTGLLSEDQLVLAATEDVVGEQAGADDLVRGTNATRNGALGLAWVYVPSAEAQVKLLANVYRTTGGSLLGGGLLPRGGAVAPREINPPPPVFGGVADTARFDLDQDYALEKRTLGLQATWRRGRHLIEGGAGVDWLRNDLTLDLALNDFGRVVFDAFLRTDRLVGALADSIDAARRYRRYQAHVLDRITSPRGEVTIEPSLRYDYYGITGGHYLSPRLSVSVAMSERTTVRLAAGRYLQSPGFEKLLDPDNLFNLARFASLDRLGVEEALHLGASLTQRLGARWQVRAEGYWKQLDDLLIQSAVLATRPVATFQPAFSATDRRIGRLDPAAYTIQNATRPELTSEPENGGAGTAYGVEWTLEHRAARASDRWNGWLTYAWARAEREQVADGAAVTYPFAYDRRHTINLVVTRRLGRGFEAGVTWRFGSGFPYTPAAGFEPLVATVDDPATGTERGILLTDAESGRVRLVPSFGGAENVHSARLPAYHRLDARLTYRAEGPRFGLEVYLDVINVYNRRNVARYAYYVDVVTVSNPSLPPSLRPPPEAVLLREPTYMFPLVPSLGASVSF